MGWLTAPSEPREGHLERAVDVEIWTNTTCSVDVSIQGVRARFSSTLAREDGERSVFVRGYLTESGQIECIPTGATVATVRTLSAHGSPPDRDLACDASIRRGLGPRYPGCPCVGMDASIPVVDCVRAPGRQVARCARRTAKVCQGTHRVRAPPVRRGLSICSLRRRFHGVHAHRSTPGAASCACDRSPGGGPGRRPS